MGVRLLWAGPVVADLPCVLSGCVIAELFTEGVPLFDLSQLLAYRRGLFQTEQVLLKIEDRSVRDLVAVAACGLAVWIQATRLMLLFSAFSRWLRWSRGNQRSV